MDIARPPGGWTSMRPVPAATVTAGVPPPPLSWPLPPVAQDQNLEIRTIAVIALLMGALYAQPLTLGGGRNKGGHWVITKRA